MRAKWEWIKSKMASMLLSLYIIFIASLASCSASLYDPHVFPNSGPFFEGWYIRFVDHSEELSFGVLFGKVLPADDKLASKTWFMGIIIDGADDSPSSGKLMDYDCFPSPEEASLTVNNGQPVTRDPDVSRPAHFEFNTGSCGYVRVKPDYTDVRVTIANITVEAKIGKPRMWSDDGQGPMGWLQRLPLPLYWFVYSIGSSTSYRLILDTGKVISGSAVAHMEKNWGGSFPPSWLWLQGVKSVTTTPSPSPTVDSSTSGAQTKESESADDFVSFAVTYGPVGFYVVTVPGHLAGYRRKSKNLAIDFRPDNSYASATQDACSGQTVVTLTSILNGYKMEVTSSANLSTFSKCLYGPMTNGFRQVCKESFQATAIVKIYKRNWFSWSLIDTETFQISALEFGGNFSCHGECVPTL